MKYFTIFIVTAVIVIAGLTFYLGFQIRSQRCAAEFESCDSRCRLNRDRELDENRLRRTTINLRLSQDLIYCMLSNLGNQPAIEQCRREKTAEAERRLAILDAMDEAIWKVYEQCRMSCANQASSCDWRSQPHSVDGSAVSSSGDFTIVTDCIDGGVNGRCIERVDKICMLISGACANCTKSLCGGGDWVFESDFPVDVTLFAAADPSKDGRVISTSSISGKQSVLSVPPDIKLNDREKLFLGFNSTENLDKPLKVLVRRSK